MDDETKLREHLKGFRRALWILGGGLLLAYAIGVPMKAAKLTPHATWITALVGPAAVLGMIASVVAGPLLFGLGRRCFWFVFLSMTACLTALMAAIVAAGSSRP